MGALQDLLDRENNAPRCEYGPPADHLAQEDLCRELATKLDSLGVPTQWLWRVACDTERIKRTFRTDVSLTTTQLTPFVEGWPIFTSTSDIQGPADIYGSDRSERYFVSRSGDMLLPATREHIRSGSELRRGNNMNEPRIIIKHVVCVNGAERTMPAAKVGQPAPNARVFALAHGAWFCEVPEHEHRAYDASAQALLKDVAYTLKRLQWRDGGDFSTLRP